MDDQKIISQIVTDKRLDAVWGNANFGSMEKRDVIKHGVLKVAGGYHQGYTSKTILEELGLKRVNENELTSEGKRYLYHAWNIFGRNGV